MQFLGIDQWQASQYPGINAVALGVAFVIATQVSHFLTVDQIDRHIVAHEIDGNRKPGHARGLHHHLHCGLRYAVAGTFQELIQITWPRLQGEDRGGETALLIEHNGGCRAACTAKSSPMVDMGPPFVSRQQTLSGLEVIGRLGAQVQSNGG